MILDLLTTAALHVRPDHHAASRSEHRKPVGQIRTVTAYCNESGHRNAAGNWPTVGTAAGNAWPLGTRLHVAGVGDVTVEDRSAPGVTDVDLFMGDDAGCEARAVEFGRRQLYVSEVAA